MKWCKAEEINWQIYPDEEPYDGEHVLATVEYEDGERDVVACRYKRETSHFYSIQTGAEVDTGFVLAWSSWPEPYADYVKRGEFS